MADKLNIERIVSASHKTFDAWNAALTRTEKLNKMIPFQGFEIHDKPTITMNGGFALVAVWHGDELPLQNVIDILVYKGYIGPEDFHDYD